MWGTALPANRQGTLRRSRVRARGLPTAPQADSSPTDSRSSPSGHRSPSHRCRDSSLVRVPPRLVAFSIAVVAISTRRAASPSTTSKEMRKAEAGVAYDDHVPMCVESLGEDRCGRFHPVQPHPECLQASLEEPCRVGGGDEARQSTREVQAIVELVVLDAGDPGEEIVVAGEHLGGAVERDVATELERAQPEWGGERCVAHHGRRMGGRLSEVRHRQHRVRGCFDQDQVCCRRRCACLVVSSTTMPHGRRWSSSRLWP